MLQKYCAYQERCKYDVARKMKQLYISDDDFDSFLIPLEEEGFINETRYALSYVRSKFEIKKKWKIKIRSYLVHKKIEKETIESAILQGIEEENYLSVLKDLIEKKKTTLKEDGLVLKIFFFIFLKQKGFESDLVLTLLDEII